MVYVSVILGHRHKWLMMILTWNEMQIGSDNVDSNPCYNCWKPRVINHRNFWLRSSKYAGQQESIFKNCFQSLALLTLNFANIFCWIYFFARVSHYGDVIMSAMTSEIASLTIVYSIFYSGADQRKFQSSASLAFVWEIHRWPVNSPYKGPVTRKMFPFDDVIMSLPKSPTNITSQTLIYITFNVIARNNYSPNT